MCLKNHLPRSIGRGTSEQGMKSSSTWTIYQLITVSCVLSSTIGRTQWPEIILIHNSSRTMKRFCDTSEAPTNVPGSFVRQSDGHNRNRSFWFAAPLPLLLFNRVLLAQFFSFVWWHILKGDPLTGLSFSVESQ